MDKDLLQLLRHVLLVIIKLQEENSAVAITLAKQGLVNPAVLDETRAEVRELWLPARKYVEKLGTDASPSLDDIWKLLQGPIQ